MGSQSPRLRWWRESKAEGEAGAWLEICSMARNAMEKTAMYHRDKRRE
jgi:hypothetical protein